MFRLKTYDLHKVPRHGGVMLASNHQSFLDPILVAVHLRRPTAFLARDGLFKNPFFGRLITDLNAFPVNQERGDLGAMRQAISVLQAGWTLNVFPEGSRTEDGRMQPIKPGAALVIKKACVPVVPIAIRGSYEAWPRHRKLPRPGNIFVLYGDPVRLDHLPGRQITEVLEQRLHAVQADLSRRILEEGHA
ncbi:MAG: lysophospholipid acyltransferase family protein [Phycisphaerae bacterium]